MKKISIIIPVHNERATLEKLLRCVSRASTCGLEKEIIIVDDCSTDGGFDFLKKMAENEGFCLIRHSGNWGKGRALRNGFSVASGDIIIIQDADLEYDPSDWEKIIAKFKNKETRVVYGSRNISPSRKGYVHYVFGAKILTELINFFYKSKLTDSYTGYKCFRRELLDKFVLSADGFEIEAELTCRLLELGCVIEEVAINYCPRKFEEGKKINWKDGIFAIRTIMRCRFAFGRGNFLFWKKQMVFGQKSFQEEEIN